MVVWDYKDPDEVCTRAIDFTKRLGFDSIQSVDFSLATAAGTAVVSSDYTDRFAIAKISGGTLGQVAKVLCEITTAEGQTLQETAKLPIRAR